MTPTILYLILGAVALVAFTVAGTRWSMGQAPGKAMQTAEHELARVAAEALAKLADKAPNLQRIAAEQATMALKDKLLAEVASALPVAPPPITPAGSPVPPAA